jgi:hypothetical protein
MEPKMNNSHSLTTRFATHLAAALLLAVSGAAQAWDWNWGFGKSVSGSGTIKSETRNVTGFTGIKLALPANVIIRQGNTESVLIETDDNILPLIETVVEDGALKIRPLEKNSSFRTKTLNVTINAKTVNQISAAGSGTIRSDALKADTLKVSVAGSGDVILKSIDATTLNVSIAGSGDFTVSGKANALDASIAGSGEIKAGKLETQTSKISVAGSGNAVVWAKESLKLSVAGSGDVQYYGDAKVSKSIAGSGSVKRLGDVPPQ